MLKVLVSFPNLGIFGGIEQSMLELLPRLPPLGIEPVVAVFSPSEGDEHFRARGIKVEILPRDTLTARFRSARQALRRCSPDLVQLSAQRPGSHVPMRLACRTARVPVLATLASSPDTNREGSWKRRLLITVDRWTTRHLTTQFHAVTSAMKAEWVEVAGLRADRIAVVERGRDRNRLGTRTQSRRDAARTMLGIPRHATVLLNVARQVPEKGQACLVDAFGAVAARVPEARLLIAGVASRGTSDLEAQVALSPVRERIRLLGQRDDIPDLLAAADVFVFPSSKEGFGGAMVEAMAMRLPVVASDIPSLREVTQEGRCAVLVPPGDPQGLAQAIMGVLFEPQLANALGERGELIFDDRFTIERCVPRMAALYEDTASRRRGRWTRRARSSPSATQDQSRGLRRL